MGFSPVFSSKAILRLAAIFALLLACFPCVAEIGADIADRYEAEGLYKLAIVELKRSLFLAERASLPADPARYLSLARCYAKEGDFDSANEEFARYRDTSDEYPNEACELELEILEGLDYAGFARIRLFALLRHGPNYRELRARILRANAEAAIAASEWENERTILSLCADEGLLPAADFEEAKRLIDEAEAAKAPPKVIFCLMSAIIPGSGQAIAGDPLDGAKALAVNVSLVGLSAFSLSVGDVTDFALLEAPLFLRFYVGNVVNAANAADKGHERRLEGIKERLRAILGSLARD